MAVGAPALNMGYLGSLLIESTYLAHVSTDSLYRTGYQMVTIVHQSHGDHPKIFVA